MFKIYDGRTHFYQWDLDRKLIVEDASITQVHFCNKTSNESLVVEVYELEGKRVADVPNILLQDVWRICVYGYDKNYTKHLERFEVYPRSKPQSYIYTETEILSFNTILEKMEDIEGTIEEVVSDYLVENPPEVEVDLSGYYNKEETDAAIAEAVGAIEFPDAPDAPDVDLSNYYTKKETDEAIESAIANIDIPEGGGAESVNEVYVGDSAPTDENVELWIAPNAEGAEFALKSDIPSLEGYAKTTDIPDVSAYQTEAQVNALINTALGVIENGTY